MIGNTPYLGDYRQNTTVRFMWASAGANGASITRSTDGTIKIYKDAGTTPRNSQNGITDSEDFNGKTGVHQCVIDLSDNSDSGFYVAGSDYFAVLEGAVIDTQTVNYPLVSFSIENRMPKIDVAKVNGVTVNGAGTPNSPWGP